MMILIQSHLDICFSVAWYQQISSVDLRCSVKVMCQSYDHWKQKHAVAHTSTADIASCKEKSSILIMGRWCVSSLEASLHNSVISDHIISACDLLPDRVLMNLQWSNKTWYSIYDFFAISLLLYYQSLPRLNQIQAEPAKSGFLVNSLAGSESWQNCAVHFQPNITSTRSIVLNGSTYETYGSDNRVICDTRSCM